MVYTIQVVHVWVVYIEQSCLPQAVSRTWQEQIQVHILKDALDMMLES